MYLHWSSSIIKCKPFRQNSRFVCRHCVLTRCDRHLNATCCEYLDWITVTLTADRSSRKRRTIFSFINNWSGSNFFLVLLDCLHESWTCTVLSGQWRVFVLVSSFLFFLFLVRPTCAKLSWPHSAFLLHVKLFYRISYRIV